ncbi:MAG TPA: AAA family ATPase [Nannocystaceae bacterium]|nr:AAA family ATPase [Nannocystaceae bacterium]
MTRPTWFANLRREADIRGGILLYGNTRDLFWSPDVHAYDTLPQLLMRDLPDFTIRASWDLAQGLRFAELTHAQRWERIVARHLAPATRGAAYHLGDPAPAGPSSLDLEEVIARYRHVLAEPNERPLLVLDWSHLLVTQPAHPDPGERRWLLRLAQALVGEATQRLDSDAIRARRGLCVLVSANLGAIPPVLYQGEPRVRLLAIPAPGRDERRGFFERHLDDLRIAPERLAPGATAQRPRGVTIDLLADATDQLTTTDLRQLVLLSGGLREPATVERLLNLYRFGDQRSPWEELSVDRLRGVHEHLRGRVLGQDAAVEAVATMIVRAWLGLAGLQHSARRTKPKGTLFFVGPTGVGKTELAKACAEFLFGDESACIRFDMSEYNHEHSDQRLVGAPPGYVGFEDGGQLTNAVTARPFSVLLFDEIEKAHGRVLDKFLQILEDGRLTDGRGETAWFSESVIIFTSNLGAADAPAAADPDALEGHFRGRVEEHFVRTLGRPELLNRLGDNIVVFQPIAADGLRRSILERKLAPLAAHLRERRGAELRLGDGVLDHIVGLSRPEHGGRGLLNAVERALMNPLSHFLFQRVDKLRRGRVIAVEVADGRLEFELSDA